MTNDKTQPCLRRIDADCFRARPAWAKQAFAYRIVHLLTPKALTKRLPKGLRRALLAPGVVMPPGVELPPGVVVGPGGEIPAGWTPGDPLPPGAIAPGETPPGTDATGITPPTFVAPGEPGPVATGSNPAPAEKTEEIISSTSDGMVQRSRSTWISTRTETPGDGVSTTAAQDADAMAAGKPGISFIVKRSFFYFPLTEIPAGKTVTAVTLTISGWGSAGSSVCVQQGKQADTLTVNDYLAFSGVYFAYKTWALAPNILTFNAAGLAYIQSVLSETAKLCCREYTHDYVGTPPGAGATYYNGCRFAETALAVNKPRLTITYK